MTNRRFLLIGAGIVVAVLLFLWFAPINAGGNSFGEVGGDAFAATLLILLLCGIAVVAVLMLSGADSESGDIARQITSTPAAAALLERWLRRSRYYRFVGGLVAFILSSLVLDNDDGLTQLLFVVLCGVAFGGALAEVHVLRRRRGTAAAADLTVRTVRDFTDSIDLVAMAVVAITVLIVPITAAFGWSDEVSVRWCIGALLVILAVLAFQYLVARRSRPALRPELREADDLLRYLAATQGFARPAIAAAFVMAANALDQDGQVVLAYTSAAFFVAGAVWWYRGRHSRIPELARRRMTA